jgi:hypothetical protein
MEILKMSINLRVTYLPIEDIIPSEGNPRTHSKKQIQLLADCIGAYKIISPLIVDQNKILLAGEARFSAAKLRGLKVVPTICVSHLSEAEKRGYVIADNRIGELADWSPELLKGELEFLSSFELEFNTDLTGFSTTEIDLILENDIVPSSDDDFIPFADAVAAVSQPGDIWQFKSRGVTHKVICGDCRDADTIDMTWSTYLLQPG